MRCAAALASAFEEVAQVRYSRSGSLALSAAEPGSRPKAAPAPGRRYRPPRSAARRCRRSGLRKCRGDRRLDIFATPGTGIALPFTPGRNHCAPFATGEMRQFWSIGPADEQRLCWNLNALLQKIGDGNRGEITISWMVKPVTDHAIVHRGLRRGVAVWCRPYRATAAHRLSHHEIATSRRLAG